MISLPKNLKDAVLATLCYFDVFDFPLTSREIQRYIIGFQYTEEDITHVLETDPRVESREGLYCLSGRTDIIARRLRYKPHTSLLWQKIYSFLSRIRWIPFIKMIGVCNNLAFDNADNKSDIDLFIVTDEKRLFTARFLVTAWMHLLGVRRHGTHIAGRFCLSFYVSTDHLNLEDIAHKPDDLYLAYWIKTLRPVFGETTYRHFLLANNWASTYFPLHPQVDRVVPESRVQTWIQRVLEKLLSGRLGGRLEAHLASHQLQRAHTKKQQLSESSGIIISNTLLKFHDVDRRETYQKAFIELYEKILKV